MKCRSCGKEEKPVLLDGSWVRVGETLVLVYIHKSCKPAMIKSGRKADPERIIAEVGAKKLSETKDGRSILEAARQKYKAELVQPGDPEFNKLYGKQHKEQAEIRKENETKARKMWAERGK